MDGAIGWAVAASKAVAVGSVTVGIFGVLLTCGGAWVLGAIYRSIAPLPPTERQLAEERLNEHPLFRHMPLLKGKIAWRQIGVYPTPIHAVNVNVNSDSSIQFFVKREDLASVRYGGNKLRTLQHQLAACEAHLERHPSAVFSLIGSYGSNQAVATKVHAQSSFDLEPGALQALTFLPDRPDFDNTLNLLSSLSLGGRVVLAPLAGLRAVGSTLWSVSDKVFAPGGHNVTGLLGQIGACLELAEQIERGELPDPDAIYLPYGSGCTTSGLVIGVALARHLGLKAFRRPGFKIVSCVVHHAVAFLHRNFAALFWASMPLSISWSINAVCEYLVEMGVVDLQQLCHATREQCLELVTEPKFVGMYGSHSEKSLPAAQTYDASGTASGAKHNGFEPETSPLWLCGHFAAKPYAVMEERLRGGEHKGKNVLFWQTKSATQPVAANLGCEGGVHEEARRFDREAFPRLKRWASKGKAFSANRQGSWPGNYRHLMKEI